MLLTAGLVKGVGTHGCNFELLLGLIVTIDNFPTSETGFNCCINHHFKVIYWIFEAIDLLVQFNLLEVTGVLESLCDVLAEYPELVNVCPFEVREGGKVFT